MPHFHHAAEKLRSARRDLMLPHRDELESLVSALLACDDGLADITPEQVDDADARRRLVKLRELMDLEDVPEHILTQYHVKASRYTYDDKIWLTDAVDSLADWFWMKSLAEQNVSS